MRIFFVTALCALGVAGYSLWDVHRYAGVQAASAAQRLAKQLSLQWLRISTGTDLPERFPDMSIFESARMTGLCARYEDAKGHSLVSTCVATDLSLDPPGWFDRLYRNLLDPVQSASQPVTLNRQVRGNVIVTTAAEQTIAQAWRAIRELFGAMLITLAATSLMIYLSLTKLLDPAAKIVNVLEQLRNGQLHLRLPEVNVTEFDHISSTINRLAVDLQKSQADRDILHQQLLDAHEEERRWLTRELHDEIGQCLAGISALSASIRCTAEHACPSLVTEADHISQTVERVMLLVQNVLVRLRPPELEQLGLADCIVRLVDDWNRCSGGRTVYSLTVDGSLAELPPILTVHVYRIVQEALSNAAKHAAASRVEVKLKRLCPETGTTGNDALEIEVTDDGCANHVPTDASTGLGLRGMRERAKVLGGQFALSVAKPSGFSLQVCLPLYSRTLSG